ncbi:MAG: hypothetical protein ABIS35_06590 [Terracoccus sp.]
MPRWLPFVIAVPVLFGVANHGGEVQVSSGDGVSAVGADSPGDGISDNVRPVADTSAIEPRLVGLPTVAPWSPTDTPLRVEVVSDSGGSADVQVQTTSASTSYEETDFTDEQLPAAYDVTTGPDTEQVHVFVTSRSRDTVQCRIYEGEALVASESGVGQADCTLSPAGS